MSSRYLKPEHHIFRQSFRRFLQKEAAPFIDQWEKDRLIPRAFWRKLGANGYLCPGVHVRYGGLSADFVYSVVMIEELERVASGLLGVGLHNDIVVPYIQSYGTEEQKKRWLPKCITGDLITAVAMTEPGAGSDLAAIQTTAVLDGDDYILNGQKTFISNGIHADLVIVACKTDPYANPVHKGVSLLVVEENAPGFSRGKKLDKIGLHCQDTAELFFEDCRVPKSNLLGEEGKGFTYLMQKLQQERLVVAISAQVAAEEMFRMTLEYVQTRQAFGQPLSRFQHTQFQLAEMATEIQLGRTFVDSAIEEHIAGKAIEKKVSMAKWWITEMAKRTAAKCQQLHGGYGYIEEYPIARRFRDIMVTSIYAGTTEVMKGIIAKHLMA
ncbi:acyl-CoA dehydrogenase family protein [Paenactinomyces guangxiensis]|uniref:Acyl-CoA dehydrogenase family protein n=1 Tax=Paenactinomyces guangxiensis TaxID=1490290 RepID=A0A7W1WRD6_9BACL|nr:acyl-CoA dehydrogenase family protein [Paenactinomyces guangxiensis]MBA4494572.1 acyl-CoA dehydrogenase family protein [Paenactinomyces guangxiensis]MBH8591665.1 acyl-CoA dehydrogenase family protein [Paenactinomyces guangxiensis]